MGASIPKMRFQSGSIDGFPEFCECFGLNCLLIIYDSSGFEMA